MSIRIMLAGGGTGGHVYPLLAVAGEIRDLARNKGISVELEFIGTGDVFKSEAVKLGIPFRSVISPKWRRYFSFQNFVDIIKAPFGLLQATFAVWKFMPDVIFAKGGYAAFLPAIAAKLFMIPLCIHETDAIPGSANLFLSRLAKKTFVAIESSKKYFKVKDIETVGNPLRKELLANVDRSTAASTFQLDPAKPILLITGASQGAKTLNDAILVSINELIKDFQVIHQTGPKNYEEVKKQIEQIEKEGKETFGPLIASNYRVYPVFDTQQMQHAYSACDVIISRSGSQIFETSAVGKPAVLVPLKISAQNHQLANAYELAKFGAIIIEEDNLTPLLLINEIKIAYDNRTELSAKIRGFARLDAGSKIAIQLLNSF